MIRKLIKFMLCKRYNETKSECAKYFRTLIDSILLKNFTAKEECKHKKIGDF